MLPKPYYEEDGITIYNADCREVLPHLPRVDLVLTDPPYGTTQCNWDSIIPFDEMWTMIETATNENTAVILFSAEPFASMLRMSNMGGYKYDWFWLKSHPTGFLNAWKQPLRKVENISVFYDKQPLYVPQITDKPAKNIRTEKGSERSSGTVYGGYIAGQGSGLNKDKQMPTCCLEFNVVHQAQRLHPTQKPLDLLKYLMSTYTEKDHCVLDFTMGSGTTLVAAKQLGRKCIGVELEEKYCQIAVDRLRQGVLAL